jgi:hypothetical protein
MLGADPGPRCKAIRRNGKRCKVSTGRWGGTSQYCAWHQRGTHRLKPRTLPPPAVPLPSLRKLANEWDRLSDESGVMASAAEFAAWVELAILQPTGGLLVPGNGGPGQRR